MRWLGTECWFTSVITPVSHDLAGALLDVDRNLPGNSRRSWELCPSWRHQRDAGQGPADGGLSDGGVRRRLSVGCEVWTESGFPNLQRSVSRRGGLEPSPSARPKRSVARPWRGWRSTATSRSFCSSITTIRTCPYDPPPPFPSTYAGEIAYVDAWIGKVMDKLRALGLYDNTLVVVAGDHGEGLGEHGETEHGFFIYQEHAARSADRTSPERRRQGRPGSTRT